MHTRVLTHTRVCKRPLSPATRSRACPRKSVHPRAPAAPVGAGTHMSAPTCSPDACARLCPALLRLQMPDKVTGKNAARARPCWEGRKPPAAAACAPAPGAGLGAERWVLQVGHPAARSAPWHAASRAKRRAAPCTELHHVPQVALCRALRDGQRCAPSTMHGATPCAGGCPAPCTA